MCIMVADDGSTRTDLVAAKEVDDDGQIGHDHQPVWLKEAKSCQQVAWDLLIAEPATPKQACLLTSCLSAM